MIKDGYLNNRCLKIWWKAVKQNKYRTANMIMVQPSAYLNNANFLKKHYA